MIPKIIHQTYKSQDLVNSCATFKFCQEKTKKVYYDYEYRFYSDSDMMEYVKENFSEYHEIFLTLPAIMKADIFRYFLMIKDGGIYSDLDYLWFHQIPHTAKKCLLMEELSMDGYYTITGKNIANCVFASEKNFSFWISAVEEAFKKIKKFPVPTKNDARYILKTSGPFLLEEIYKTSYTNNDNIKVFDANLFNSEDFHKTRTVKIFKERSYWSGVSSCSMIDHPRTQKLVKKFETFEGEHKYYGIHLHTNSWFGSQGKKYNNLVPRNLSD